MNKDTLALLSGMAPQEPEGWAVDPWREQFEKDYPKPAVEEVIGRDELFAASDAVCEADCFYEYGHLLSSEWGRIKYPEFEQVNKRLYASSTRFKLSAVSDEMRSWLSWHDELFFYWTRDEWPLIWAKKRLQSVALHDSGE